MSLSNVPEMVWQCVLCVCRVPPNGIPIYQGQAKDLSIFRHIREKFLSRLWQLFD